jgi:hypothetical protein
MPRLSSERVLAALIAGFFIGSIVLLSHLAPDTVTSWRPSARISHHRPSLESSRFVTVALDSPVATLAASGLATVLTTGGTVLLAIANFWGESVVYELDCVHQGLAPRLVQRVATKAAHDWEAVRLEGEPPILVAAEYEASRSLVYILNASHGRRSSNNLTALGGWPNCRDAAGSGCIGWAASGECVRNPAFMHTSCADSCGRCKALTGPLVAIQELPGLGGTAARFFQIGGRRLLFVANYLAPPREGVSVYEWQGGATRWHWQAYIDAPGAGEVAYCPIAETGEQLLVFSSWFANGSFATSTLVYALSTSGNDVHAPPAFARRQALSSHGSHDAECFSRGAASYLLLANGRTDGGRRDVSSWLYRYDRGAKAFVKHQQVPSVGAHDFEVVVVPRLPPPDSPGKGDRGLKDELLVVVANGASWSADRGGDGELCDAVVDCWRWDDDTARLMHTQRLDAGGCTTFARAWTANGRTLLAVATERRTTTDHTGAINSSTYEASLAVFEWLQGTHHG